MGTYIIATLLFLALAYALYKIFSKRGKCCGNCGACRSQPLPSHSIQPC